MFIGDHKNLESDKSQKIKAFNDKCLSIGISRYKTDSSIEKDLTEALTSIILSNIPKASNKEFEASALDGNELLKFAFFTEQFFSTVSVQVGVGEEFLKLIHQTQNQISESKLFNKSYILDMLEGACTNISLNEVFPDKAKIGNISIKNEIEKEQNNIKKEINRKSTIITNKSEATAFCFAAGLTTVIAASLMTGLGVTVGFPLFVLLPVGLPLVLVSLTFIGGLMYYNRVRSEAKKHNDIILNSSLRLADLKLIADRCADPSFQQFLQVEKYDLTKESLSNEDLALFKNFFANQKKEFQSAVQIPVSSEKGEKALALEEAIKNRPKLSELLSKIDQEQLQFLIEHCSKDVIQNMRLEDLLFTALYLRPFPNLISGKTLSELNDLIESTTPEIRELREIIEGFQTEISKITDQNYINAHYLMTLEVLKNESPDQKNIESEAARINSNNIARQVAELEYSIKTAQDECITLAHKMFEAKDKEK